MKDEPPIRRQTGDPVICSRCGASVESGHTRVVFYLNYQGHADQKIVMNCKFEIADAADGQIPRPVCDGCFRSMLSEVQATLQREEKKV